MSFLRRVQPLVQWVNCQALDCKVAGSFIVLMILIEMLQRPVSLHFHHLYYAFLYFVPSCFHGYDSITGAKINEMKKMMSLSFTIICLV